MKIMLHCTDCVYSEFEQNELTGRWRGTCKRGYTLANPHEFHGADRFFVDNPDELVPVIDPRGHEYLRTKDICDAYVHISDIDKATPGHGGIFRFFKNKLQVDKERAERKKQAAAESTPQDKAEDAAKTDDAATTESAAKDAAETVATAHDADDAAATETSPDAESATDTTDGKE